MNLSNTAMVLAAGFGKRMGAISQHTPKPLIPIKNTNCLEITINALANFGFKRIIVNTHHLHDQIEKFLKKLNSLEIIISYEENILETAGGVRKVLHEFGNNNFVVANADMYWKDTDPSIIYSLQKSMNADDHFCLGVVPHEKANAHPGNGDFVMTSNNLLKIDHDSNSPKYVYMGVQIINPYIIKNLPIAPLSLATLYKSAAASDNLRGAVFNDTWIDVGTPNGLEIASTRM